MSIKSCRFYIIFVDSSSPSLQLVPNARDDHDALDEARRILEAELNAEREARRTLEAELNAEREARRTLEEARLNAEREVRRIMESRNEVFSVLFLVAIIFMIYILFATAYSWAIKFF
jgi:regulator of protease activity HflC (stomatin/prohibitin superfamily)